MAMQGDPNKNNMFFHHPVPIPLYVRLSCDATAGSSAAAAGGASTSSSTGGAVGRVDLKDQPNEFLVYIYKVKRCSKTRSHDWTECPYAHGGEKARHRDPTKYRYSGIACPEFQQRGECPRVRAASMPTAPSSSGSTPPATAPVCARTATPAPTASASLLTPEQLRPGSATASAAASAAAWQSP